MFRRAIVVLMLSVLVACSSAPTAPPPAAAPVAAAPPAAPAKNDYGKPETWLCRPGRQAACATDQASTVVAADGKLKRETWKANPNPPIDCFYVYPTVSRDPTPNSDMQPGEEELSVVRSQFARFGSQCRPFAPLYRQVTLAGLRAMMGGGAAANWKLGFDDVVDAWNYYLEHDNNGRGVVLIGHSQGSLALTNLISKEIEGKPVQAKIISAILLGTNIMVPKGKDVGGTFKSMPLCKSATQTGCVITYVSFRDNSPPPPNSIFGLAKGDTVVGCTNPSTLAGGKGELNSYLAAKRSVMGKQEDYAWVTPAKAIDTPFVRVPGLLTGKCVNGDKSSYLAVTVKANPKDPRTDDIPGDLIVGGNVMREWGLHLIDVNLGMGNLLDIVGKQSKAYLAPKKSSKAGKV
jgi:hypothetical protein